MNLLSRWFGAGQAAPSEPRRWIVLDVETTGLDMREDHLLAIAAVALHFDAGRSAPRIALHDSFEAVLQRAGASTDKDNILVHGIGVGAQSAGAPPQEVLAAFEHWIGPAPLIAWHAAFDRAMLDRSMKRSVARLLPNPWLDLAPVATALHPQMGARALDDWFDRFGIACTPRHQAAADTLATAELLLRLWPRAREQGCANWEGLVALDRQQRWLQGR
jgi:DNA polymerase-3 subunit epsilon